MEGGLRPLPEDIRSGTEADAYEVQRELHDILAARKMGPTVGYKIGCTTKKRPSRGPRKVVLRQMGGVESKITEGS